jgi:hypothetical protein
MTSSNTASPAAAVTANRPREDDHAGKLISPIDQVLMDELKSAIGNSPVQADNGPDDLGDIPACLDRRRRP